MQEIKVKALELVDKYAEQLEFHGIKIILSKKYTETEVRERSSVYGNAGQAVFNIFDRAIDRKKEKEKGYNFERNKYHSIVITVVPLDKALAGIAECREYAFVLKKVERAHLGQEPQKKSYQEAKVLAKIEKKILKILKKAGKNPHSKYVKTLFGTLAGMPILQNMNTKLNFAEKNASLGI